MTKVSKKLKKNSSSVPAKDKKSTQIAARSAKSSHQIETEDAYDDDDDRINFSGRDTRGTVNRDD